MMTNDAQYAAFCALIDRPLLASDPRYSTGPQRNRNRDALIPSIAEAMLSIRSAAPTRCRCRGVTARNSQSAILIAHNLERCMCTLTIASWMKAVRPN